MINYNSNDNEKIKFYLKDKNKFVNLKIKFVVRINSMIELLNKLNESNDFINKIVKML